MHIDGKQYGGLCACGKAHGIGALQAVIEAGCLGGLDDRIQRMRLPAAYAAIYDENSFAVLGDRRPRAQRDIILPADGLRGDERAMALVMGNLPAGTEMLVALGGGTLCAIVAACAEKLSLPYILCPTAASGAGFLSGYCHMTLAGRRQTIPVKDPALLLADVDILAAAPMALTRAGLSAAVAGYVTLGELQAQALLKGKPLCPAGEAMMLRAAVMATGCASCLHTPGGVAQLMVALALLGLSRRMLDGGGMAAGPDVLMQVMDWMPDAFPIAADIPHGAVQGALALALAGQYHRMMAPEAFAPYGKAVSAPSREDYAKAFGEALGGRLFTAHARAPLSKEALLRAWEPLRRTLREMPTADGLREPLEKAGCLTALGDLGLSGMKFAKLLRLAPLVCGDNTLLRLWPMLKPQMDGGTDTLQRGRRRPVSRRPERALGG